MSDYIDILLTALEDELYPLSGARTTSSPLQQANDALTALSATLTDQQRALLDSYEDASRRRRQRLSGRLRPQGLPPRAGGLPLNGLAVQRPGVAAGDGPTSAKLPDQGLVPLSAGTRRLPSVREVRGYSGSSLSPSTSTRTVLPT